LVRSNRALRLLRLQVLARPALDDRWTHNGHGEAEAGAVDTSKVLVHGERWLTQEAQRRGCPRHRAGSAASISWRVGAGDFDAFQMIVSACQPFAP